MLIVKHLRRISIAATWHTGLACSPMAPKSERRRQENTQVAAFIEQLRDRAGFESWAEFGRAAGGFSAEQMSDWSRGENAPSGYNLLSLIWAAERRREETLRRAALATDPDGAEVKVAAWKELTAALDRDGWGTAQTPPGALSEAAAELLGEIRAQLTAENAEFDARLARLEAAAAPARAPRGRRKAG